MSLLKKHIANNPIAGTREAHYVTLINAVPSQPVLVDGDYKAKMCVTIADSDGALANFYPFRDSIAGLPSFIPKGGLPALATLQETEHDGKKYVNMVALGVGQ